MSAGVRNQAVEGAMWWPCESAADGFLECVGQGSGDNDESSSEAFPEAHRGEDHAKAPGVVGVEFVEDEQGVRGVEEDAGVSGVCEGTAQGLVGGSHPDQLAEEAGGVLPGEGFPCGGEGFGISGAFVFQSSAEVVGGGVGVRGTDLTCGLQLSFFEAADHRGDRCEVRQWVENAGCAPTGGSHVLQIAQRPQECGFGLP
ncbi:hypothetical protein AMK22_34100 [Streptomyces sp. CB01580]|nr:hypothetical protein AMK22_34100 [Streptomyces sp. CB01580]